MLGYVKHRSQEACRENSWKNGTYTETVEPVSVPKRPSSNMPIPCTNKIAQIIKKATEKYVKTTLYFTSLQSFLQIKL